MKAGAAQVARVDEDEVVNLLCWVGVCGGGGGGGRGGGGGGGKVVVVVVGGGGRGRCRVTNESNIYGLRSR